MTSSILRLSLAFLILSAAAHAEPLPGSIPITTRSPAALEAFREGQRSALNFATRPAMLSLEKAIALDPGFALATAWLGKVTRGPKGLALCEKAAQLARDLTEAERMSVNILLLEQRGEDEQMRKLKRELADLAPRDWFAQFQAGVQASYDNKSQASLLYLNRAIAIDPNRPEPYNYRGYREAQQGQFELGIADLNKMVSLVPNDPNSYDSLGDVLMLAGKFDEAEVAFNKAAELSPETWMSWVGEAYARFFRRNWAGGRQAIDQALKSKLSAQARFACQMVTAWSFAAEGKPAEALRALDEAEKQAKRAKAEPELARAGFERATLLLLAGRVDEVAEAVRVAEERMDKLKLPGAARNALKVRGARVALRAATVRHDGAQMRKAAAALESAFEAAPSNEELRSAAHFARGELLLENGSSAKAMAEFMLCQRTDYFCKLHLLTAQEKQGDKAGAKATRDELLTANTRDLLNHDQPPSYLYVRTQVSGSGSAK